MEPSPTYVRGFTLVELLVVIFIIGIVSSYTILRVGARDGEHSLYEEAGRLRHLLLLATEEALVSGRPIGILLQSNGYRFMVAGRNAWKPLHETTVLSTHALPQDWQLELYDDGHKVILDDISESTPANKVQPQVIFFPSGEIKPFQIVIFNEDKQAGYQVRATSDGELDLAAVAQDLL
nr:type II secretion system minor pseudopilin GspH [Sedimenticola hydrogenitrophicus]